MYANVVHGDTIFTCAAVFIMQIPQQLYLYTILYSIRLWGADRFRLPLATALCQPCTNWAAGMPYRWLRLRLRLNTPSFRKFQGEMLHYNPYNTFIIYYHQLVMESISPNSFFFHTLCSTNIHSLLSLLIDMYRLVFIIITAKQPVTREHVKQNNQI